MNTLKFILYGSHGHLAILLFPIALAYSLAKVGCFAIYVLSMLFGKSLKLWLQCNFKKNVIWELIKSRGKEGEARKQGGVMGISLYFKVASMNCIESFIN